MNNQIDYTIKDIKQYKRYCEKVNYLVDHIFDNNLSREETKKYLKTKLL